MAKYNKSNLTEEKVKVYEIIFGMFMKLILMLAGLAAFFTILYCIIKEEDTTNKTLYTVFDSLLGSKIYLVYRHYFPTPATKKPVPKKVSN